MPNPKESEAGGYPIWTQAKYTVRAISNQLKRKKRITQDTGIWMESLVDHSYNSSPWELEAGGLEQVQP